MTGMTPELLALLVVGELTHGATKRGGYVRVPNMHPTWPGLRRDQLFAPDGDGMILAIRDLSDKQKEALGL